ncbi:hypothetical protein [Capnocytophaga catalasegens]|uniref:Homeodomain phBC6A51-type domain-containing protein n=1 Tax=Capnocytophaga catalasegens TaxID=1004260 RepID=A0AAV5AWW8_9FLAO|nr:hypothetical protein [Capnocytophaga catalasegens]GIZ15512.1 hypothetical protein RCZ03_15120 [Capnocytophaga catalasegens]GJM49855.1 hypothetical protein RCZ15_08300 [Capnocytophaga catalasegens]GJM54027.1 hypothetical protein RCZ16_23430 [Capnocytophaga catalasegens]
MSKKIKDEIIADIYAKKSCNISATCSALNITRKTFYSWREKRPKLNELLKEAEESIIDFAESKLLSNIQEGDTTSLIFFLKTKGKHRGYVEKVEQEVTVNPFFELMKIASTTDE